jgi:hypothetical protein
MLSQLRDPWKWWAGTGCPGAWAIHLDSNYLTMSLLRRGGIASSTALMRDFSQVASPATPEAAIERPAEGIRPLPSWPEPAARY